MDLTFTAPTHPLSINRANGMHWAARERLLEPWRKAAWVTGHNARVCRLIDTGTPVTIQAVLPFRSAIRRDPHNYTGTVVKAVVDGIKTAGIIPDDTPEWVTVLDPELVIIRDKAEPLTATIRIRPRRAP